MEAISGLVVDDDPLTRRLLDRALREMGIAVSEAGSGEEAVAKLAAERPDLILLDVELGGMSGIEVCRHVRRLPDGAAIPILVMSGHSDLGTIEHALEAGASDLIAKPVDVAHLQRRVLFLTRSGRVLRELKASAARLETRPRQDARAPAQTGIGYWECDPRADSVQLSPQALAVLGLATAPATLSELVALAVEPAEQAKVQERLHAMLSGGPIERFEHRSHDRRRQLLHHSVPAEGLPGEESVLTLAVQDVTAQRATEERARRLAFHDAVTGLPNRRLFEARLEAALRRFAGSRSRVAVLFLDLDDFHRFNDRHGQAFGDELLRQVAARILECLRPPDEARVERAQTGVARLGSDEFAVLLTGLRSPEQAADCARRLSQRIAVPMEILGRRVQIGASVGVALHPRDGTSPSALLKAAEAAMPAAASPPGTPQAGSEPRPAGREDRAATIVRDLPSAVERGQLTLALQPRVALCDASLCGAEALVRWRHPALGELLPRDFIPVAEQEGLIDGIGSWVLWASCLEAKPWPAERRVSVNVSRAQLLSGQLAHTVFQALIRAGLPPERLELEITESLMYESEDCLDQLRELEASGVSLALDDFGAGFSSLSALVRFPIDVLKIDRSLVNDVEENPDAALVLRGVARMAHDLGMRVVAEGVDRPGQIAVLREAGCDEAQGFYFSHPLAPPEFREFVLRWDPARARPR